jgi:hypothetical protein
MVKRIALSYCVALLLVAAACGDDPVRRDLTGPAKPSPAAAVAAPEVDTAKASSICRAAVRKRQLARLRLSRVPGDLLALSKAKHFGALVTAACK